jgi:probable rRNA maturation factor
VNEVEIGAKGISRPRWWKKYSKFLEKAMDAMGVRKWEVSVLLCDDAVIHDLNKRYRRKDAATDILSFRQADARTPGYAGAAGDIVISLHTVRRNAERLGLSEEEELKRVGVHGLLHLAGMDHGRGKSGAMLKQQEQILRKLARERIIAVELRRY